MRLIAGRASWIPFATERRSGLEERRSRVDVEPGDASPMSELGLAPGTVIAETYRVERALGAGGMGVVALAHDERLDRRVAIKFIRPELFDHSNLRGLFLTEARAMARVTHPNVLTVHAFGEHEGIPFFVMEYVEGETVEDWLSSHGEGAPPDVSEAIAILDQACLGVSAIHAAKTVHRDLKPSNLLIDRRIPGQPRVAVGDLGVARILEGASGGRPCAIVGSAAYMAPEAALCSECSADLQTRRDIYALGCIAYELLTGRPPFSAPTDMALMIKQIIEPPQPPHSVRSELRPAFDEILLKALDKDPANRPPTADELRRALLAAHDGGGEPERILIVDDDPDWRTILLDALVKRFPRAHVDAVTGGEEAIASFDRTPYSVVLVDLVMPDVDGATLTSALRSKDASRTTPIIVMTASGGPGEWRRLSGLGADAFVVKPVEPEDVAMLIRRTLRSRQDLAATG